MNSFSSIACYAALKNLSQNSIINAYVRMISALVKKKRYTECKVQTMCDDFLDYYGFELPYHPMQTIINECIKQDYLTYNSSTHHVFPNYELIDKEDFMQIVEQKDSTYQAILEEFKQFLIDEYNIYSSREELNDRILAFIERYGIKSKTDKKLIHKVKDDYFFAAFLVSCEENDRKDILDYFDEYTVGLALSEMFIYCEQPEVFTSKGTNVYLDTGIVFRLFGIDSAGLKTSYVSFLKSIQHMGMKVKIYEHTLNEIIGIIENSKYWIGNINFEREKGSEATYYFVRNNWSREQIDEFSSSLQLRLQTEFNISIDYMDYPSKDDIHTIHEADINEMIINEYKDSGSRFSVEEKGYSISQDARSIFYTQHKNGTIVPYHINEVKNIFVTTNRSLAKVGYKIAKLYASDQTHFIPSVISDIKWGTMLWFNSPAKISAINRPRLVSAAYAAFRPSPELSKIINKTLISLVNEGRITPEKCYLLKVDPMAQRLFAKNTANNPDNFVEATPFEIMKELEDTAFQQGSISRQDEIDSLNAEKNKTELQLAIEKQNAIINDLKHQIAIEKAKEEQETATLQHISNELDELNRTKSEIDKTVAQRMKRIKILLTVFIILSAAASIVISIFWDLWLAILPFVFTIFGFLVCVWKKDDFSILSVLLKYEKKYYQSQCELRRYSESKVVSLNSQKEKSEKDLNETGLYIQALTDRLKEEEAKIDRYSIDIACVNPKASE